MKIIKDKGLSAYECFYEDNGRQMVILVKDFLASPFFSIEVTSADPFKEDLVDTDHYEPCTEELFLNVLAEVNTKIQQQLQIALPKK